MGSIYSVARVPGVEGFRNVCALTGSCGGVKQVILLWNGYWRAGLTPVQTLESSLENAYSCLLKEWGLCQSFDTLVLEDTEAKCPWQSAGVGYPASGIPSGRGLPESLMSEAGRHLWRLAAQSGCPGVCPDGFLCTAQGMDAAQPTSLGSWCQCSVTLMRNWWAALERSWELLLCNIFHQCFLCQFLDAVEEDVLWSFYCAELQSLSISKRCSILAVGSWN